MGGGCGIANECPPAGDATVQDLTVRPCGPSGEHGSSMLGRGRYSPTRGLYNFGDSPQATPNRYLDLATTLIPANVWPSTSVFSFFCNGQHSYAAAHPPLPDVQWPACTLWGGRVHATVTAKG